MLASAIPAKIQVPFATTGDKVTIPVASQIGIVDGRASWTTGFVPLNGTPLSAGGVAPFETDFNGIFNQMTAVQQWQCAGAGFKYDAAFSTAIDGYPAGAMLTSTSGNQAWLNLVDNNSTDPNGGSSSGWVLATPGSNTGVSLLTSPRTLTRADIGAVILWAGGSGYVLPTPSSLGLLVGNRVTVCGGSSGSVIVVSAGSGATIINGGVTGSVGVQSGQSAVFIVASGTSWQVLENTAAMQNNADFNNNLIGSGWQKLPGGFVMQWGVSPNSSGETVTGTFPIAFPIGCLIMVGSLYGVAVNPLASGLAPLGTTQYSYRAATGGPSPISSYYIAIGR